MGSDEVSILEEYLDFRKLSESPVNFHRWAFLSCCAALLGRNVHMVHGTKIIYPNMYVLLVGASGSRKSQAITPPIRMLEESGYQWLAFEKSSKQKFVQDMQDSISRDFATALDFDTHGPTECFVANDELLDFIGVGNLDFVTLLTKFWDNLPKYEDRFKRSESVVVHKPTVNILGGLTQTNLQLGFNPNAEGIGFLARTIMIYGETTGHKITWPEVPDIAVEKKFIDFFKKLRNHRGVLRFDDKTRRIIDEIYHTWAPLVDARLSSYSTRRLEHLFRLLLTIVSLRFDTNVTEDDIIYANTILAFAEERMTKALGEFGKNMYSTANQRIITYMEEVKRPCTLTELWKIVQTEVTKWPELINVLNGLMKAEKIQASQDGENFILCNRQISKNSRFVNYDKYIREAKIYEQIDRDREQQTKLFDKAAAALATAPDSNAGNVGELFGKC